MGAGAGISMHGKYRIATERTIFAMPETAIGFIADNGFYKFFEKLPDNIGLYMGLTGHIVKGYDVRRLGIATHFVNESDLNNLESDLCASNNVTGDIENILLKYDKVCEGKKSFDLIKKYLKYVFTFIYFHLLLNYVFTFMSLDFGSNQISHLKAKTNTTVVLNFEQLSYFIFFMNFIR